MRTKVNYLSQFLAGFHYAFMIAASVLFSSCSDDDDPQKDFKAELFKGINDLRQNGCTCGTTQMKPVSPLVWNSQLEIGAQHHASDMITRSYFSHISPEGKSPVDRAQEAGYQGMSVGEVIARGYTNTSDVLAGWQESESHCKALMDSAYNEIGGAKESDYWVVDLGRSL